MKIGEEADEVIKKINVCRNNTDLNNLKAAHYKNNSSNSIDLNEFFIEQETRIAFGVFQNSSHNKHIDGSTSTNNEYLGRKRLGEPVPVLKKINPLNPTSPKSDSSKGEVRDIKEVRELREKEIHETISIPDKHPFDVSNFNIKH